jgi:hypothetical protein
MEDENVKMKAKMQRWKMEKTYVVLLFDGCGDRLCICYNTKKMIPIMGSIIGSNCTFCILCHNRNEFNIMRRRRRRKITHFWLLKWLEDL